jgi:hypothetical protein
MNDKDLLELAAKAAGAVWIDQTFPYGEFGRMMLDFGGGVSEWNPLTDDGDALRLAVKLKIDIEHLDSGVHSYQNHTHLPDWADSSFAATESADESDLHAAARRAIVRSAAEIGKGMK